MHEPCRLVPALRAIGHQLRAEAACTSPRPAFMSSAPACTSPHLPGNSPRAVYISREAAYVIPESWLPPALGPRASALRQLVLALGQWASALTWLPSLAGAGVRQLVPALSWVASEMVSASHPMAGTSCSACDHGHLQYSSYTSAMQLCKWISQSNRHPAGGSGGVWSSMTVSSPLSPADSTHY